MASILEFRGVQFVRQGTPIIQDFNWQIEQGQHWVMLGPNGAGKSTLVALMCAREWPTRGSVSVLGLPYAGQDVAALRKRLGIFQPALQSSLPVHHPGMSAEEVILTGLDGSLALYQEVSTDARSKVRRLYETLFPGEMSYTLERPFRVLSSGECRRVLLMRCFIQDPEFVMLDEPYESLDIPGRLALEGALDKYLKKLRIPSLTVLHRIEEIPIFATHLLMLKQGRLLHAGLLKDVLNSDTLSDLYDCRLKVGQSAGRYYCIPA